MLNLIKLKICMVYPLLKLHILFNSNGQAIWSGFPDIKTTRVSMTQKHSSDAKQVIVLKVADRLTRLIILLCKIKRTKHMHLVPEIYIFTITGYIATFFFNSRLLFIVISK